MRNKQQKGFTLIELLVVIVILGILSTISVGTFRGYFAKARDAERLAAVTTISTMIQVDSAGRGDATTYNYFTDIDGGNVQRDKLKDLLESNDYSMPETKNGLKYYYAFKANATDDNNDYFVFVSAEDSSNQNAQEGGTAAYYAFVAGTTNGVEAALMGNGLSACYYTNSSDTLACNTTLWTVLEIQTAMLDPATP